MSSLLRLLVLTGLVLVALLRHPAAVARRRDERAVPRPHRRLVEKHRLLTDIFRQQVRRELRDGLRSALGDLAERRRSPTNTRKLADIQAQRPRPGARRAARARPGADLLRRHRRSTARTTASRRGCTTA